MDERVISDLRVEIALRVEVALGNGDGHHGGINDNGLKIEYVPRVPIKDLVDNMAIRGVHIYNERPRIDDRQVPETSGYREGVNDDYSVYSYLRSIDTSITQLDSHVQGQGRHKKCNEKIVDYYIFALVHLQ
uniref:Uncharacterized protein n=1 Tax=Cucumis melo TaxID=3656 RepID=A0A9I9DGY0_CUCME